MVRFIHTYPYLMLSLTMLGAFLGALVFVPRRFRSTMLLSGALAAPFALSSPLFVPYYWTPTRVAVALTGFEDIAFTFSGAGLAWVGAVWPVRHRLAFHPRLEHIWWRYLAGACFGLAIGGLCRRLGGTPMDATILAFGGLSAIIVWRRRELWPLALAGAPGYAFVYVPALKFWHVLVPSFGSQWNPEGLWGPSVIGLPLDELAWAAAFGLAWPTFAAYLLDARLRPAPFSPASEP
jgi:hypothetical protein